MKTAEASSLLSERMAECIVNKTVFLNETTIEVHKEHSKKVLSFLKLIAGYEVLMDLTGIDYLQPEKQTQVIYWLHNPRNFERIRIAVFARRNDMLPSVTDLWEGADWYERELFDFFGIYFLGHPDLKRLLMPEDWIGNPLLKDYTLTEEPVEFKHGVKPKIPSEIIGYEERRNQKYE